LYRYNRAHVLSSALQQCNSSKAAYMLSQGMVGFPESRCSELKLVLKVALVIQVNVQNWPSQDHLSWTTWSF